MDISHLRHSSPGLACQSSRSMCNNTLSPSLPSSSSSESEGPPGLVNSSGDEEPAVVPPAAAPESADEESEENDEYDDIYLFTPEEIAELDR